ncbi:2-hydroxyacid dehydrogenase [Polymorphum gilvum]|uniref:D-isomer specific 2-hydroxyacid dehydrogenase, NAD-binding protein n=1 Tax=Polymorphum gilvum (strain LMG 25793 / CGMCC 1.9160 / SL003B-26A1) TaxID=991905 RepID=F2IXS1_POLGS|nr:glyoxylate/hydroxypyruvate reductase A [Polymorphum gilvum]ADZ69402.1 D-isomer specific 2-hydroxyacid dehydrogenase, NAD-binding protein [Polymorphum gilvum SL003B-26A1]
MTRTVPFLARMQDDERAAWMEALPAALAAAGLADVAVHPLDRLDTDARQAARVAIVANPEPADLLELPNLVWVQSLWAGVERLLSELPPSALQIVRMTDPQMAETMAEAVLAWTLYLHRDMPRYRAQQRARVWHELPLRLPSQRRIGLLGLGTLGRAAARRLIANGFAVAGWSRTPADVAGVDCHHGPSGLVAVLERADIAVALLPLTAETRGLLDKTRMALLPRGAAVINFARGPILDTDALRDLLDSGHLSHAVLDVFEHEPLPADDPLWAHPQITVLPHISAPTTPQTAAKIAADNLAAFFATGAIPQAVDRARGY